MIDAWERLGLVRRGNWSRYFAVSTAAGLFFGLVGPFGSYLNGPVPVRMAYWLVALWMGTAMFGFAQPPMNRLARKLGINPYLMAGALTLLGAIPLAVASRLVAIALWPGLIGAVPHSAWFAQTLLISAVLAVVQIFFGDSISDSQVLESAAVNPFLADRQVGSFHARLPVQLGRDLVALQMEDHFVRAHTRLGSALVLIPLHQAIGELHAVKGIKIHRSWWVAQDCVTGFVQDGRNFRLRLVNGVVAPVARASVAEVRRVGLLGGPASLLQSRPRG